MKNVKNKNTSFIHPGNVIYLTPADFELGMTYIFTASGIIDIYLCSPAAVDIGSDYKVTATFPGAAKPQLHPFNNEKLDGQNATGSPLIWLVPSAIRLATFVPCQSFSIISDYTNWQLTTKS